MRFIYKNITEETKIVSLLSDDKASVSSIPLGAGARLEVENSNLDIYVPHILARLDENGNDISHIVLRNQELPKAETPAPAPQMQVMQVEQVNAPVIDAVPSSVEPPVGDAPPTDAAPVAPAAKKAAKGK